MGWAPHRKQPKNRNIYVQKTCQNKQKISKKYKKIEKKKNRNDRRQCKRTIDCDDAHEYPDVKNDTTKRWTIQSLALEAGKFN